MKKAKNRSGQDRRCEELGPPQGWKDRRKKAERRMIEVIEIPFEQFLSRTDAARGLALSVQWASDYAPLERFDASRREFPAAPGSCAKG